MNDNRPKGNQKHLDLSSRIKIEQGLNRGDSFRVIARAIGKDPSTISKEVRKHSYDAGRHTKDFARIPCANNHNPEKPKLNICYIYHACGDEECSTRCVQCRKYRCADVCSNYVPRECAALSKPPYVCNGCPKSAACLMERKLYSAQHSQSEYEDLLISSREGINQDPGRIQEMNEILTPLISKGQSVAHIYATHADELGCSSRTIYNYIDRGVFDVKNIDLRRKVKYKKRKRSTQTPIKDRSYRKGRTYKDFLAFLDKTHPVNVVEMDTVEGKKGTRPCFLTMLFRNCNLMLMFLLREQTQAEVLRVFNYLTDVLGIELFQKLFEVILTDNGSEFQYPEILEADEYGEIRTRLFYCDPNRSDQKGALEKNHEYIRYVLPKKTSFEKMDDSKTLLLLNHINSTIRDSLNGHSPYEVSRLLLDNRLHQALGLMEIPADEVTLIPALVK